MKTDSLEDFGLADSSMTSVIKQTLQDLESGKKWRPEVSFPSQFRKSTHEPSSTRDNSLPLHDLHSKHRRNRLQ